MDECSHFPLTDTCVASGTPGCNEAGYENSYDCRLHHVNAGPSLSAVQLHCTHGTPLSWAAEDPAVNAVNAGPCITDNGLSTAHGLLDDLCNNIVSSCGGYLTTDIDSCRAAMWYVPGRDSVTGDPAYPTVATPFPIHAPNAGSNSFACRRYHAYVAATTPDPHCLHATTGAGVCGSDCDFYCGLIQGVCVGTTDQQYTDVNNCLSQCAKIKAGPVGSGTPPAVVTSGDTLGCRIYHASVAAASTLPADVSAHCSHAGFVSTPGTCGASGAFTASASLLLVALLAFFSLN